MLILAFFLIVSALAVVTLRHPLYSALALIAHMTLLAGAYAIFSAHFVAAAQVIVYAGAIMVLVLFVIMLLNAKVHANSSGLFYKVSGLVAIAVAGVFFLPGVQRAFDTVPSAADSAVTVGGVREIGQLLFTRYVVLFELASVVIFVAVVAAVLLATKRRSGYLSESNPGRAFELPSSRKGSV